MTMYRFIDRFAVSSAFRAQPTTRGEVPRLQRSRLRRAPACTSVVSIEPAEASAGALG